MQNITQPKSRGVNQLRKGRVSIPGQIYHVTAVTNGKVPVFRQLSNDAALSGVVQNVKANSGRLINSESRSTGPIWQRGFYDRAIRRDEDLPAIARYIVANPLRAGIARSCGDYPLWDSIWV
jgi:REP element-mobilizing transposase RayT